MSSSFKKLKSIAAEIHRLAQKRKIVFVSGNFNILHPGHMRLLQFAMQFKAFLVIAVQSDKLAGNSVWIQQDLRLEAVRIINGVNYAFLLDDPPEEAVRIIQPDIVIKGKEHESKFNPETEVVKSYGGKIIFSSGDVVFSSVDLLRREYFQMNAPAVRQDVDYLRRHDISGSRLLKLTQCFSQLKVLVIGDIILDEYITCDPVGMSREEPTIVVTPISKERFIGAAAIVAEHAAALGAETLFFSISGKDDTAEYVKKELSSNRVASHIFPDESRPTTIKQRFRAAGKNLLRLNILRQHEISKPLQQKIFREIKKHLPSIDLLIFSDFNYGCLPQPLVEAIELECQKFHIPYVADSQSSSQVGDVSRFHHAELLTPTEHELRLAIQDNVSGMVVAAEKLRQKTDAENLLVTLGAEGVFIHKGVGQEWQNDRLPALNPNPKDVAGAGDSLLIAAALTLAAGGDIWEAAYIGSVMAACQVSHVGNTPLSVSLIQKILQGLELKDS